MSYTIIYARAFVKTTRGILPIALCGSNNVWQVVNGREVRERYWTQLYNSEMIELPEEALMSKVRELHPGDNSECFMYRGRWVDDAGAVDFFQRGINNAHTVEEYSAYDYDGCLSCELHIMPNDIHKPSRTELFRFAHTTFELEEWLDEARAYKANDDEHAFVKVGFGSNQPIKMPPRITNEPVIGKCGGAYVCDCIANKSMSTSSDIKDAIVFENVEDAYNKLGKGYIRDVKFIKASNKNKPEPKAKDWVLVVSEGSNEGYYVRRLSKTSLFFSYSENGAKRFGTEKQASKYFEEKIRGRFKTVKMCTPTQIIA